MNLEKYHNEDLGKLILRLTLGILMLFHGVAKLFAGVDFIGGMLSGMGLPSFIAYGVYVTEIIAPIFIIIGYKTKLSSLVYIAGMIMAIILVHLKDVFALTPHGGWAIELQMMYILPAITLFFIGAGKYSLDKK
jgi:putative oxidoreductase